MHLGLQEMNKGDREILMGFSIFYFPREGQPAKQTRKFKRWSIDKKKERKKERKEPDQLTRQSDQANLQSDWNMETERGPIHSKKPQQIELKLEIFRKEKNPIQK